MAKKNTSPTIKNTIPFTGINEDNIVCLYSTLFRAIEIAKLGNHSISVYYDNDYTDAQSDYDKIKDICKGFFEDFKEDGDMKIQFLKPTISFHNSRKLTDITKDLSLITDINVSDNICKSSEALLKTAINKLDLSLKSIDNIYKVAKSIAKLCSSGIIKPEHIAESIHYAYTYGEINAESSLINLNNMVYIRKGIDKASINEALEYLEKMKS